jgi:hypothetical protein
MFGLDDLDAIAKIFNFNQGFCNNPCKSTGSHDNGNKGSSTGPSGPSGICPGSEISLTPSQLLVIAGFVAKVLEVNSVLVDKSQQIQIILTGSLKRPTQLDSVMQQIGQMPFETVFQSLLNNLG